MTFESDDAESPAKRSRFEIKFVLAFVVGFIVVGATWVALHGSPTRNRAGIDSSSNPTSTIQPQPQTTAPARP